MVTFSQCAYGLSLPGSPPHTYVRKNSSIASNLRHLSLLERPCPGKGAHHRHEVCWGSRVYKGKSISLAAHAGRYPSALVALMAQLAVSNIVPDSTSPDASLC